MTLVPPPGDAQQLLFTIGRNHRNHHPPPFGKLKQQRLRDFRRRRGHQNTIIGTRLLPAPTPVTHLHLHVIDIEAMQQDARLVQEGSDPLDAVHLLHQLRQDGRLITTSGSYLQHLVARAPVQQRLRHEGDQIGLGDSLAMPDGECRLLVCPAGQRLVHEQMAGNGAHHREYCAVPNAPLAQLLGQPVTGSLRSHADPGVNVAVHCSFSTQRARPSSAV